MRTDGDIERSTRLALEASVAHLDARVRSRLTQARHAALDELRRRPSRGWLSRAFVPAAALGASAVVAILLWSQRPDVASPPLATATPEQGVPAPAIAAPEEGEAPAAMLAAATSDDIAFVLGEDPFDAAFAVEEPSG